jgi:hypothetical protein
LKSAWANSFRAPTQKTRHKNRAGGVIQGDGFTGA